MGLQSSIHGSTRWCWTWKSTMFFLGSFLVSISSFAQLSTGQYTLSIANNDLSANVEFMENGEVVLKMYNNSKDTIMVPTWNDLVIAMACQNGGSKKVVRIEVGLACQTLSANRLPHFERMIDLIPIPPKSEACFTSVADASFSKWALKMTEFAISYLKLTAAIDHKMIDLHRKAEVKGDRDYFLQKCENLRSMSFGNGGLSSETLSSKLLQPKNGRIGCW